MAEPFAQEQRLSFTRFALFIYYLLALGTQVSNSYELRCLPIPLYLNTSGLTTLSDICFLHTYLFIHPTYPIYLPR